MRRGCIGQGTAIRARPRSSSWRTASPAPGATGSGRLRRRFRGRASRQWPLDHRGFGDSGGEPDLFHPRRQREDWREAISVARSLPGADPERVATFGSSMGGGNALAAAAEDPRVAAAISQVPFLDIRQAHRAPLRVSARMVLAALLGRHLPAVGQPDEAAFINAPGGESGWRRVVAGGEDSRWRNRASARWLLTSPYRTSHHAAGLHCPWLVCVGEADRVARPGPAIAAAKRAPQGELWSSTRASITSTSTTGPSTRPSSATNSPS